MEENNRSTAAETSGAEQLSADLELRRLEADQNLPLGIVAGTVAAVLGAVAWAAISVATDRQYGAMAIAVGFLVATAVRLAGRGVTRVFRFVGAGLAVLGCILGNLFTVVVIIAKEYELKIFEVLGALSLSDVQELLVKTFDPIDLLFYGLAIYAGYQFSLRKMEPASDA